MNQEQVKAMANMLEKVADAVSEGRADAVGKVVAFIRRRAAAMAIMRSLQCTYGADALNEVADEIERGEWLGQ